MSGSIASSEYCGLNEFEVLTKLAVVLGRREFEVVTTLTTVFEAGLDAMVVANMLLCCGVVSLKSGTRLEQY
jgi:hypothetical protein